MSHCGRGCNHRIELIILAQEPCPNFTALLKYDQKSRMNFLASCTIFILSGKKWVIKIAVDVIISLIHHVHTHMHAHMQVETWLILPLVHLWAHGVHHTCVLWVHRWQGGFFNIGAQLSWNLRHSRAICISWQLMTFNNRTVCRAGFLWPFVLVAVL